MEPVTKSYTTCCDREFGCMYPMLPSVSLGGSKAELQRAKAASPTKGRTYVSLPQVAVVRSLSPSFSCVASAGVVKAPPRRISTNVMDSCATKLERKTVGLASARFYPHDDDRFGVSSCRVDDDECDIWEDIAMSEPSYARRHMDAPVDGATSGARRLHFELIDRDDELPAEHVPHVPEVKRAAVHSLYQIDSDPRGKFSLISLPGLAQDLLVGQVIRSKEIFWDMIIRHQVRLGLQFIPTSYHLGVGERLELRTGEVVELSSREESDGIKHYQYYIHETSGVTRSYHHLGIDWADRGVPSPRTFRGLFSKCRTFFTTLSEEFSSAEKPRMYVHCFGGHGRSGTFVLAWSLAQYDESTHPIDLLRRLRGCRDRLIETRRQLEFAVEQVASITGRKYAGWQSRIREARMDDDCHSPHRFYRN